VSLKSSLGAPQTTAGHRPCWLLKNR